MLGEALKLDCFAGYPVLYIPRSHGPRLAEPNILKQFCEGHSQTTSSPQSIFGVDVIHVDLEEEKLNQRLRICETLED